MFTSSKVRKGVVWVVVRQINTVLLAGDLDGCKYMILHQYT